MNKTHCIANAVSLVDSTTNEIEMLGNPRTGINCHFKSIYRSQNYYCYDGLDAHWLRPLPVNAIWRLSFVACIQFTSLQFHFMHIDPIHGISIFPTNERNNICHPTSQQLHCDWCWLFENLSMCTEQFAKFKHSLSTFNSRSSWGETNVIGNPFQWNIPSSHIAVLPMRVWVGEWEYVHCVCAHARVTDCLVFGIRCSCESIRKTTFNNFNGKLCVGIVIWLDFATQTCHCSNFDLCVCSLASCSLALWDSVSNLP